jgi:hypothetical protein
MEREITRRVALCDEAGRLRREAIGWSRQPLHDCRIAGRWGRRKRWHHWCVTTPEFVVSMTIADLDYLRLAVVQVIDLDSGRVIERQGVLPLSLGQIGLPNDAAQGEASATILGVHLAFRAHEGGIGLVARARGVVADIEVERRADVESLNVVVPWSDSIYQYTSKQFALRARGEVTLDGVRHVLREDASWACLDFGRGIWPYRTRWNWASAAGRRNGRVIGMNLGGKWTDGTGATENGLSVDGTLHKISSDVVFRVSQRSRAPWSIAGRDVDLTFTPSAPRRVRILLGVAKADLVIAFGAFRGRILDHRIDDLFGWAEELDARW